MKSAGNRGVVQSRLQVLHVHVFLVAPMVPATWRSLHRPASGRVAIGERPHHAGSAANLTVQPLDHVICADARPVLAGKIAVGQCLLNAVLDLLGSLLQFHRSQFCNDGFCLLAGRLLALLAWIALSIFATILTLDLGTTEKTLR